VAVRHEDRKAPQTGVGPDPCEDGLSVELAFQHVEQDRVEGLVSQHRQRITPTIHHRGAESSALEEAEERHPPANVSARH
jgi:hypothetical protein